MIPCRNFFWGPLSVKQLLTLASMALVQICRSPDPWIYKHMVRSDGISFDHRSEIWTTLYHEQLSEDDKKIVPQRAVLYRSKNNARSSWFLTIRSMEYVWGSNGHRAPFLFGFQSKHRNGHGQQHKRWGICTAYTIWTRTLNALNVDISDKYTWTMSRI